MKPRKQRRRGRPAGSGIRIKELIWEYEPGPDAEENILQALEMLLPPPKPRDPKAGREVSEEPPPA